MGRNDNLISAILSFLIICIFGLTIYFCLDIFAIIDIPDKYSLAEFFSSKTTDIAMANPIEGIINKQNIDEWINEENEKKHENLNIIDSTNVVEISENNNFAVVDESNKKAENVVNRMYYSQLDVYGRMIYDELNSHREELKTGTYVADFDTKFNDLLHTINGEKTLEQAFQTSVNALVFDNPEIFYIDVTKMYMHTETSTFGPFKTYRIKIGPLEGENYFYDNFYDENSVKIAINQMENEKDTIIRNLYGEIYYQIKDVHDYIIFNSEYDRTLSRNNIYTAYGTLVERVSVCEGYAKAFKYVLDELGIPCIIVCGIGQNSKGETESHAWNYVKIDDAWYAIDCTWDDPVIIGNGHVSNDVYSKYLLKGSQEFFVDHQEDGNIVNGSNFVYPTISEENYR